jgi:hypothetical protein
MVLATEGDGADGTFDGVGVEFDASVIEEPAKCAPTGERIPDCISKAAARRNPIEFRLEPNLRGLDNRQRFGSPHTLPYLGRSTPDGRLDRIELSDAAQGFGRNGRAGRVVDFIELPSRMGPACRQLNIAAGAQPLKARITVDLNHTSELCQMRSGTLGPTIGTIEIDDCRRVRSVPGPVITGVDPEPAGFSTAAAGIEHRDRCVVGE